MGDSTAISTTTQDPNNNTLFDGAEVVSQVTGSSALKKSKEQLFSCDSELHYVDKTLDFFVSKGNSSYNTFQGTLTINSQNTTNTALKLDSSTNDGGILIKSGTQGTDLNTTGPIKINSIGSSIDIGDSSNTTDINVNSSTTCNLSSSDILIAASDDLSLTSTSGGNIIMDVNGNNVNNALKISNDGNILINKNTTDNDYQMEVNVATSSTKFGNLNGILVNSSNPSITPDLKVKYQNTGGSKTVVNSLGVYSETNTDARYREYVGYQFGNQIITIDGPEFQNNDIGKQIYFNQGNTTTNITGLGTIIIPADNTNVKNTANTLTVGGNYTGASSIIIKVEIDSTNGSVDTFRWSKDAGKTYEATFVLCSFAHNQKYPLSDGIYIQFTNKTGHTLEDFWIVQAKITAVVSSDGVIITGSVTRDTSTSETVVTGITNNVPTTTTSSSLAGTVLSSIISNQALSGIQKISTNAPFQGFLGTTTNSDLIFKTANEERFKITADGSLGVSKDNIDGRLHLTSNFNKEILVNDNLIASGTVTETTNLADNIINSQQNSVSCELQTGGYVVVYESFDPYDADANADDKYNIYGNFFSGNGEKIGSSFKINVTSTLHQFSPHVAKSGDKSSDNYLVVWVHQTSTSGDGIYQIRGQIFTNNNEKISSSANSSGAADIVISDSTSDIYLVPRVVGLSNGNYVIAYTSKESSYYQIRYVILNSTGTEVTTSETLVTSGSYNFVYPYLGALSSKDPNYEGGFVVTYLKQVHSTDVRYQILFKVYSSDASSNSGEQTLSDSGISNADDVTSASDLAMTDGLVYVEGLSDEQAKTSGGFLVSYQNNFSGNVDYATKTSSSRNVIAASSAATGDLIASGVNIDSSTGIQTWALTNVTGNFLKGEIVHLVATDGTYAEKIETVTVTGTTTVTVTLSKDPKNIVVTRYNTSSFTSPVWTVNANTTNLVIDKNKEEMKENTTTSLDFTRANDATNYAFRNLPIVKGNENDEAIVVWQNKRIPDVYYQRIDVSNGSFKGEEKILSGKTVGLRQTSPFVSTIKTTQGFVLGYAVNYTQSNMDLSNTAIYKQLIGSYGYLLHLNNETVEMVMDHEGKMGIGTKNPDASIHIKSIEKTNTRNIDTASIILQNNSTLINNEDDSHKISFTNGSGTELARLKVKYSENYQDLHPKFSNLKTYYKFDEQPGTFMSQDSGIFNIQSETVISELGKKINDGLLINFDVEKCWVDGKVNNGLEFDGVDNFLKINSSSQSNLHQLVNGSFTMSMWLNISQYIQSQATIFGVVTAGGTLNAGTGQSLTVTAITMNLVKGTVITFSGGGILTLTQNAIVGATTLTGDITNATISSSHTSTSIQIDNKTISRITAGGTLSTGAGQSLTVTAITMNLVKGTVITFSGGGVLTLTHRANKGDTTLKGDVTNTISNTNTSTSIVMNTVMELFSSGTGKVGTTEGGALSIYLYDTNNQGKLYPQLELGHDTSGSMSYETTTTSVFNDSSWHHFVVRYTRSTKLLELIFDTTTIRSVNLSNHLTTISATLDTFIGSHGGSIENTFRGTIDEMRFYDINLTDANINKLYKYGSSNRAQLSIQTLGDNTTFDDLGPGLILDDTGKLISGGFKNSIFKQLTGRITATSGSTTITGTNTKFTQELQIGDFIRIDNVSNNDEIGTDGTNAKLYKINSITNDTSLVINRVITDITATTHFDYVTVLPSIFSAYNLDDDIKMCMDFTGDLVIGPGKSNKNLTKFEIRGSGTGLNVDVQDKNSLTLTNTTSADTDLSRSNKIQFKGTDSSGVESLQSVIEVVKDGGSSDNKARLNITMNNTSAETLTHGLSISSASKVNMGQAIPTAELAGDLHIRGQNSTTTDITLESKEGATGVFTEQSNINFIGGTSLNTPGTIQDEGLVRISGSNDTNNTTPNGRLDIFVNNNTDTNEQSLGLQSRFSITSNGYVSIHNQRPNNTFQVSPKWFDSGYLVNNATISSVTDNGTGDIITFSQNIFGTSNNTTFLAKGRLVVDDDNELTSYLIKNGAEGGDLAQLKMDSTTIPTNIVGKSFNFYYPGMHINKFGLVGIGDSSFSDSDTHHQLMVYGDVGVKDAVDLFQEGDTTYTSPTVSIKNTNNKLQIKDTSFSDYVNILGGPTMHAITVVTDSNHDIIETNSTIIGKISTSDNSHRTVKLPALSASLAGKIYTIKLLNIDLGSGIGTDDLIIDRNGANIDGSSTNLTLSTSLDFRVLQTDGVEWYVIGSN